VETLDTKAETLDTKVETLDTKVETLDTTSGSNTHFSTSGWSIDRLDL